MRVVRAIVFALLAVGWTSVSALANHVEWLVLEGAVGPVANELLDDAIDRAEDGGAQALVIELDTPGGLFSTTRMMCKAIMASEVPVVMYVSPSGSRAGSAGVFLTLACHLAAMAPGTNIGAAHPVGLGGIGGKQDTNSVMEDKVTNDAAAFARTLAEQRGRNVEWAEKAVRESESITDSEALQLGVIDLVVSTRDSLLILIDGRIVQTERGELTLETADAQIREQEISLRLKILGFLSDPNLVYVLFLLGIYGVFFELYNPGAIFPGVIGGLALILAFFGMQMLPLNWAGLALIVFGIILFLLEIKITSYGLLSIGGVVSLSLGSLMLFDPFNTGIQVGVELIITAAILTALFFVFAVGMGLRAQLKKVTSGREGLVGEIGEVTRALKPRGKVLVHGEVWDAVCETELELGERVRVTSVDGMRIRVTPETDP